MKLNKKAASIFTHEGAKAVYLNDELKLRRSVLACLLWEDQFYEDGVAIAERIQALVPKVAAQKVAALAVEARETMKLRHVPLLLVREMARTPSHRSLVAKTLERVIQRADELAEFLAIYWKEKKQPLSAQVKKGLANAFTKFDAYQLAKYNRDGAVKLRDVLFLSHAKPKDKDQEALWKKLTDKTLEAPDTWEVALSGGGDKKETWSRLIREGKLGALAFLRNLRNMKEAGVSETLIFEGFDQLNTARVLPYRFIAAARYAPQWERQIEKAMIASLENQQTIPGKTLLLVDVSGSMGSPLARKSDLNRLDAACGLAILLREVCKDIDVFTFSNAIVQVPSRSGFALRDAIVHSQEHSSTYLGKAVAKLNEMRADRVIVLTDEQSHDVVPRPRTTGYMINVASAKNGVSYREWIHIDGWSESVIRYIQELESYKD